MNLNDKIKSVISAQALTPSHFADEIGVQRSSISHILSGRNRPSLEIIQRIVKRFPEVTYEWLLENESEGPEPPTFRPTERQVYLNSPSTVNSKSGTAPSVSRTQSEASPKPVSSVPGNLNSTDPVRERAIEKILIFYNDNTFTEYLPLKEVSS